jgi:dipeptidyl aminopeptidase/acylaminoacyl peptidase
MLPHLDVEARMLPTPIDRRRFLRHAAALGSSLPLLRFAHAFAAGEPDLIPRRTFFVQADYSNVRLSPDGEHLAYLAPLDGVRNLFVTPVATPSAGRPVTRATDRDLGTFFIWAHTNRHIVFFQERDGDENWRASSVDISTGAIVPLTPERGVRSYVQERDRRFPHEMLFGHNERDKRYFDLYRIDVATGARQLVFENREYVGVLTDGFFHIRLAQRFAADGSAEVFERQADGGWTPFTIVPIGDLDGTRSIDFSDDGKMLYMLDSRGRDKAALVAIDMATRQSTVLAEDAEADIVRVDFEPETRRPLATLAVKDRARWLALDPAVRSDLALLGDGGKSDLEIVSRSLDNRLVTAFYERDAASGEFVLLDRKAGRLQPLFKSRPAFDRLKLQRMEPVVIPARDGLNLNGYLTLPAEGRRPQAGGAPLVLVIHGGPYARDQWGFSPTHQWLADRGYAALSVNYRGSTGFGKAFVTAADREWGGKMHDDLIDAAQWAIGRGLADPKRVGFWGASYGGYSALMAATKTPEVFACIVDIFGISNLLTFMATIPPYWGPWFSIWKNRLGDPDTETGRAFLTERSPLFHLERATKPILIAQGMQDVRVVAAESEQMVTALKARGVPVTYVSFSDEGHGFVRPENRLAFYAVAEAFLAQHLGGRVQPLGDDFTGSSIKIETGGELIPELTR